MTRGLKITLIAYGVIGILLGLAFIIIPHQLASTFGFREITDSGVYVAALCGATFIAASVWLIMASRDPLRHITWVKFAVLVSILSLVVQLYLLIQGVVDFNQAGVGIILDAVFAAAFLALYPYRAARGE